MSWGCPQRSQEQNFCSLLLYRACAVLVYVVSLASGPKILLERKRNAWLLSDGFLDTQLPQVTFTIAHSFLAHWNGSNLGNVSIRQAIPHFYSSLSLWPQRRCCPEKFIRKISLPIATQRMATEGKIALTFFRAKVEKMQCWEDSSHSSLYPGTNQLVMKGNSGRNSKPGSLFQVVNRSGWRACAPQVKAFLLSCAS